MRSGEAVVFSAAVRGLGLAPARALRDRDAMLRDDRGASSTATSSRSKAASRGRSARRARRRRARRRLHAEPRRGHERWEVAAASAVDERPRRRRRRGRAPRRRGRARAARATPSERRRVAPVRARRRRGRAAGAAARGRDRRRGVRRRLGLGGGRASAAATASRAPRADRVRRGRAALVAVARRAALPARVLPRLGPGRRRAPSAGARGGPTESRDGPSGRSSRTSPALGGREGGRVRVVGAPTSPSPSTTATAAWAAPPLGALPPLAPPGARLPERSRSRYGTGVAHAFATRLRMLRDYLHFLAQLESKARSAKGLGVQHLWYLARDSAPTR